MSTASRRSHRKSRGGCTPCKIRRIKCDESTPTCSNCLIRGGVCEYSNAARLAQQSQSLQIVTSTLSKAQPVSATTALDDTSFLRRNPCTNVACLDQRLIELELMNHWTASTYLTVCHQAGQNKEEEEKVFWRQIIPREALSHPYLLEAAFAVASLHLVTLSPACDQEKYAAIAVHYHNSSLKSFRETLSQPTEGTSQAIFACSLAHFLLGIALSQIVPTLVKHRSIKADIFSLLGLWSGSRKILAMFSEYLSARPIRIFLADKDMSRYPKRDTDVLKAMDRLRALNLEQLQRSPHHNHAIYDHAINELESQYTRLLNNLSAAFISWLIILKDDLIGALQNGETLASLMLMHWATMLNQPSNNLWWSIKSGTLLIDEITRDLPNLTETEQAACDWCHADGRYTRPPSKE